MRRRDFLTLSGATVLGAAAFPHGPLQAEPASPPVEGIAWQRHGRTGLVQQVIAGREPLVRGNGAGLLDGFCRPFTGSSGPPATLSAAKPPRRGRLERLDSVHRLDATRREGPATNDPRHRVAGEEAVRTSYPANSKIV